MDYSTTPLEKATIDSLWRLEKIILDTLDFKEVVQKIVDSMLTELGYLQLGYSIIVLALADEKAGMLKRISISQTDKAKKALEVTPIPFHEIDIPLRERQNYCIRAFTDQKPYITHHWPDILYPSYKEKDAIVVQKIVGIKTSMVYPVISKGKSIGVLIFSMIKDESEVTEEEKDLIRGFTDVVGLAVQNAQLYTSLEQTKDMLAKANKRLQELDKLKDDFVSMASHELRTPMTAIKSYLWMALNKKKQDLTPDLNRYIFRAYHSTERLINLVNDMLNISRIESGRIALNLSEVNLVDLAREVADEVIPKATELNLEIEILDKKVSNVLCDRDKVHEVIINLIGNSLKFTKASGKITLSFDEKPPYTYLSVTDTGVGIAKEDLARLFQKFTMLENSYTAASTSGGGTGLGLYISKSIIKLHKGDISVYSPGLGKGSTFTISLPIIDTAISLELKKEAPKITEDSKGLEKKSLSYI